MDRDRVRCPRRLLCLATMSLLLGSAIVVHAQAPQRILEQDPSLDNLSTPEGYETGALGRLGDVARSGAGETPMVLVPGLGFGAGVFDTLVDGWEADFRLIRVTLAGFGGTPAPPTPPADVSFGAQTWTAAAADAVIELMDRDDLDDAVLVGHWLGGTQVVLDVARRRPDRVRAVILLAGSARWVAAGAPVPPLEQRVANVDQGMAPRWFKTVTRETWDDNNFLPGDYAANPVIGLRLWREAARPPLHVWVRYLCEFFAQDATLLLAEVPAPVLLLHPGLEGIYHDPANHYMLAYTRGSWEGALEGRDAVTVRTIADTRAVPWADRPEAVREEIEGFLTSRAPSRRP